MVIVPKLLLEKTDSDDQEDDTADKDVTEGSESEDSELQDVPDIFITEAEDRSEQEGKQEESKDQLVGGQQESKEQLVARQEESREQLVARQEASKLPPAKTMPDSFRDYLGECTGLIHHIRYRTRDTHAIDGNHQRT